MYQMFTYIATHAINDFLDCTVILIRGFVVSTNLVHDVDGASIKI